MYVEKTLFHIKISKIEFSTIWKNPQSFANLFERSEALRSSALIPVTHDAGGGGRGPILTDPGPGPPGRVARIGRSLGPGHRPAGRPIIIVVVVVAAVVVVVNTIAAMLLK